MTRLTATAPTSVTSWHLATLYPGVRYGGRFGIAAGGSGVPTDSHPSRPSCGGPRAYARGFQKVLMPPPLMSKFMGMVGYASASFHDLMDDEVESNGSSIGDVMAPSHPLSWECAMADALG